MTSILLAGALGLLVMLSGLGCSQSATPTSELPVAPPIATHPPVAQPPAVLSTNISFQPLVGRWVRPDGGYVLEIKSAAADGKLDAGYFNPNPIHVAKAEATAEGGTLEVFVELRDVNYPGSTYTLTLEPAGDVLKGDYFQAVAQEHYPIYFERLK
jgi:hypothetical protein